MSPKEHGTSHVPVQQNLKWGVNRRKATRICNFNRTGSEPLGFWRTRTRFRMETKSQTARLTFYDSNTGKPLFYVPGSSGRPFADFINETDTHGWPSFRDDEVIWENVRTLPVGGEAVSVDGTHLGHLLPDEKGNRYCINLCSIAGWPVEKNTETAS